MVRRALRRRLRVPWSAGRCAAVELGALPGHRARGGGGRLRQPPAAVWLRDGHRLDRVRRRDRAAGTLRQNELRDTADDEGYAEPNLWTGIGRARSGAGAAIVGDPDQVLAKLRAYADLGMEAFILSGYPHAAEGDLFARHVLPRLDHAPLAFV